MIWDFLTCFSSSDFEWRMCLSSGFIFLWLVRNCSLTLRAGCEIQGFETEAWISRDLPVRLDWCLSLYLLCLDSLSFLNHYLDLYYHPIMISSDFVGYLLFYFKQPFLFRLPALQKIWITSQHYVPQNLILRGCCFHPGPLEAFTESQSCWKLFALFSCWGPYSCANRLCRLLMNSHLLSLFSQHSCPLL